MSKNKKRKITQTLPSFSLIINIKKKLEHDIVEHPVDDKIFKSNQFTLFEYGFYYKKWIVRTFGKNYISFGTIFNCQERYGWLRERTRHGNQCLKRIKSNMRIK